MSASIAVGTQTRTRDASIAPRRGSRHDLDQRWRDAVAGHVSAAARRTAPAASIHFFRGGCPWHRFSKVILKDRSSRETAVADIMAAPVITVTPTTTLSECMHTVTTQRIRHLPVVDGERVVGVLSIGDLVKAVIDEQSEEIEQLQTYITR